MKRVFAFAVITAMAVMLTACRNDEVVQTNASLTHSQVFAQMLEHRIEDVNDNSGVEKLLSFLPVFDDRFDLSGFSIQEDDGLYGLALYFEPNEKWDYEDSVQKTNTMSLYETFLFESIANLEFIAFHHRIPYLEGEDGSSMSRTFRIGHLDPINQLIVTNGQFAFGRVANWDCFILDEERLNAWHWREALKSYVGEEIFVSALRTISIDMVQDGIFSIDEMPPAVQETLAEYLFVKSGNRVIYQERLEDSERFKQIMPAPMMWPDVIEGGYDAGI